MQIKPIIPLDFFEPLTELNHQGEDILSGSFRLTGGRTFGMSVRTGLTKLITLETGINQVRRRLDWEVNNDTANFSASSFVRLISYEIPIRGLVYIRLRERFYMNNALGFSFDLYPSNVAGTQIDAQAFVASRYLHVAVEGNVGVEYRTDKSGIFYLGASLHRPFRENTVGQLIWLDPSGGINEFQTPLNNSYLTLDIRYFFHEDPERRLSRRKK